MLIRKNNRLVWALFLFLFGIMACKSVPQKTTCKRDYDCTISSGNYSCCDPCYTAPKDTIAVSGAWHRYQSEQREKKCGGQHCQRSCPQRRFCTSVKAVCEEGHCKRRLEPIAGCVPIP